MPIEHLAETLRALRRYECVQARLLAQARSARDHREADIALIRKINARFAKPTEYQSLVELVAKRMKPLEPCSFEVANLRFLTAMSLLPCCVILGIGIAMALMQVMS